MQPFPTHLVLVVILISTNPADTFEFGGGHDFTAEVVADKYFVKAATCIAGAIYYKSCKVCGDADTATFPTTPLRWTTGTKGLDHTDLGSYGQDIYSTGVNAYNVAPVIDGTISSNEGWVLVTPNGVDSYRVSDNVHLESGKSITKSSVQYENYHPEYNYYVAQTADKVYLAFEHTLYCKTHDVNC